MKASSPESAVNRDLARRFFPPTASLGSMVVLLALVGVLAVSPVSIGLVSGHSGTMVVAQPPAAFAPSSAHSAPSAAAAPTPPAAHPSASTFNPPCYTIDTGVCVSICYQGETNIIPAVNSHVANVEPNATESLPLCIKSHTAINGTGIPVHNGSKATVALNITGVLWNGDPYYSVFDSSVWHSNTPTSYFQGPTYYSSDVQYPWWYTVNISAKSSTGSPNFFPGMTVTWWIALTYNFTNVIVHHESPRFIYTYAGAWPWSPYPGAAHYAGAAATFDDMNFSLQPRTPNWNDSVVVDVNTTQADVRTNATLGPGGFVDLKETAPNGAFVANATLPINVSMSTSGFGLVNTTVTIPARLSQVANAVVTYRISVRDVAGDLLSTPWATYTVGGNGSFASGVFSDDLAIVTNPATVIVSPTGTVQLAPGQTLGVNITSRNPTTAINSAELSYSYTFPRIHEQVNGLLPLVRHSSTFFQAKVPGLPLGSVVNFSILAWDFNQRFEVSPIYTYSTPSFSVYVPFVPGNQTFFYVFVYDNGTGNWVSGAQVTISGPSHFFNSVSTSTFGVAYPNSTTNPYVPLLVPANQSYNVSVYDKRFIPVSSGIAQQVNVVVAGLHPMTAHQTLVQTDTYLVVQEGDAIVFWLNASPPAPAVSPAASPPSNAVPLTAIIGLAAAVIVSVPVLLWWRQIRAKRKEEEKRVTL